MSLPESFLPQIDKLILDSPNFSEYLYGVYHLLGSRNIQLSELDGQMVEAAERFISSKVGLASGYFLHLREEYSSSHRIVNSGSYNEQTPLDFCLCLGFKKLLEYLKQKGLDLHTFSSSLLNAIDHDRYEIVNYCLTERYVSFRDVDLVEALLKKLSEHYKHAELNQNYSASESILNSVNQIITELSTKNRPISSQTVSAIKPIFQKILKQKESGSIIIEAEVNTLKQIKRYLDQYSVIQKKFDSVKKNMKSMRF